jgi:hypothetical protein
MHIKYLGEKPLKYDGTQLAPHWIYRSYGLLGDAAVSFRGECEVKITEMVDLEDVRANAPIYSREMLHFILEFFDNDLEKAVYRQRLLITTIKESLERRDLRVHRSGDDLFLRRVDNTNGKLSVSIATASAVSTLIHTGLNIISEGTPVPTIGLADLGINGIEIQALAMEVLSRYNEEVADIWLARCKVRPVSS